jgi:arsenic resistance protein ArsH
MRSSTFSLAKRVLCTHNLEARVIAYYPNRLQHLSVLGARSYTQTMSPHSVQQNGIASSRQHQPQYNITESTPAQGDLNNFASMRQTEEILGNPDFAYRSLAIPADEDEIDVRTKYRPFLLDPVIAEDDWVAKLELATVTEMAHRDLTKTGERLKVLVLYGSLRQR